MQVKYKRDPVQRIEGQPLSLKCTAEYEEEQCGNVRVSWCFGDAVECQQLTDPDKYLIHIKESKTGGNRTRDAFISFTQLCVADSGKYRCEAACQNSGATAMGRTITVTVTGKNFIYSLSLTATMPLFRINNAAYIQVQELYIMWVNK